MSNFPAPAVSWNDVARVCRRVCVLRERGLNEDAERIRAGELMALLATVRASTDTDEAITERLNSLFATEAERVANAAVLAEILLPMIADQLQAMRAPVAPPAAVPDIDTRVPPAKSPAARPGSIADFIDDMIAQERPPKRPGESAQRRAS